MATNSKALFDKGWIRTTNRLDEKQRLRFGIASYKAYKIKQSIVGYYNSKMNSVDIIDQLLASYDRHQRQRK